MSVQILARNPTDHFTWKYFQWCVPQIPETDKIYYIWAEPFELLESMVDTIDCIGDRVWLFISDNLCLYDFNPWEQTRTWGVEILRKKIVHHPSTHFVVYSDVANLEPEFSDLSNVSIISSEYLTMDEIGWRQALPVIEKQFGAPYHWISLNHRPAAHRVTSAAYIIGQALDTHGNVVVSSQFISHIKKYNNYLDMVGWRFDDQQEYDLKPCIMDGFEKLKYWSNINDDYDQKNPVNQFGNNFIIFLSQLYLDTCVEIVQETYYAEPSFMCTEKFLNSVYGCNFPIILNGAGVVNHLENIGFDMFRDVVNHDYDKISNPLSRLQTAFESNIRLLTDEDFAKQHWFNNQDRLVANARFAQNRMYEIIWNRITDRFMQIINK